VDRLTPVTSPNRARTFQATLRNVILALQYTLSSPGGTQDHIEPRRIYPSPSISWHVARYRFATQFCGGKVCLDIACGCAYGAYILASSGAKHVIAGDIGHSTLTQARRTFPLERVSLVCLDATLPPFGPATFDTVVSFETLEHLTEPELFLSHVVRLLRPGGTFLCSTPTRMASSPRSAAPYNRWHVREYTIDEFRTLLLGYFPTVRVLGQGVMSIDQHRLAMLSGLVHVLRRIGAKWPGLDRALDVTSMLLQRDLGFSRIELALNEDPEEYRHYRPLELHRLAGVEGPYVGPRALVAVARK
jgi:SAM-dependent methyltransferase